MNVEFIPPSCFLISLYEGVPAVFYAIFITIIKTLWNFTPAVSALDLLFENIYVFRKSPVSLFEIWIKMIVPSFSTLLWCFYLLSVVQSCVELFGNVGPFLWLEYFNELEKIFIFSRKPNPDVSFSKEFYSRRSFCFHRLFTWKFLIHI